MIATLLEGWWAGFYAGLTFGAACAIFALTWMLERQHRRRVRLDHRYIRRIERWYG